MWRALVVSRVAVLSLAVCASLVFRPYDASRLDAVSPLASLANWDGVHLVHVARQGYSYLHTFAFFPGFPLLMRGLAGALAPLVEDDESRAILAGVILSNVSFVLAGLILLELAHGDRRPVWLFMCNPANIFMSAVYTESCFALAVFAGLLMLCRRRFWSSSAAFFCATAIRSNGVVLCALLLVQGRIPQAFLAGLPLLMHNWDCYRSFCPGPSAFCSDRLPNCYAYIQTHYWSNGLFAYWTLNNIPNFLLATPMLIVTGLLARSLWSSKSQWFQKQDPVLQMNVLVVALAALAVFTMNVQVVTRFLAVFPSLYLTLAKEQSVWAQRFVSTFFASYSLLGCLLFPTFYPWT